MKSIRPQYEIRIRHLLDKLRKFRYGNRSPVFFSPFFSLPRNWKRSKQKALTDQGKIESREHPIEVFKKNRFLDINTLKTEIDWEKKKKKKQIAWHIFYNQRPDLNNLLKKTYGVSNNENKKHLIFKIAWEIPTKSQINPKSIRISTWKPQIRAKNSIESTKLPMKNHIPEKKKQEFWIRDRQETRFRRITSNLNDFFNFDNSGPKISSNQKICKRRNKFSL